MALCYYVYYRVDPVLAKTAQPVVEQLMLAVGRATGIPGRLLKKRGEPNLWMEVYENVTDAAKFEWELSQAAGELNATASLQAGTGRHIECFED